MIKLIQKIKSFDKGLLPDMLKLKYEAMSANPFSYYRGSCRLFYEDLASVKKFPASPATWICGDLHLENFGSYRANNKLVYFDLNDFDEALLAPAAWELVRMITSILVAFDTLGIEQEKAIKMAHVFLKTYAATLSKGKATCIEPRTAKGIVCDFLTAADKAREKDILEKRTIKKEKERALSLDDERHFKISKPIKKALYSHVNNWVENSSDGPYNFRVRSAVFRLAGTGSIGVKRYLFLLKSTNTKNKYLLLDMKQSLPSSLASYNPVKDQPDWETDAVRITAIQQRMQYESAALLSNTIFEDQPYVIQELQPVKNTIKFKQLKDYRDIYQVIDDMATITASAQLRSGGMQGSAIIDELMAFGNDPDWQQPLVDYAINYTGKVKADYNVFIKALKKGELG